MLRRLAVGMLAFAATCCAARESRAGPVDVSYTVSGVSGSYDLNFSVTNNMLAWPTQNVYFLGVTLSVANITGSPDPFLDRHSGWNFGIYDSTQPHPELNNTWIAPLNNGLPPYDPLPGALLPGTTRSGFIVHIPDLVAPTSVAWGAISYGADFYTGGGNFITQQNPGFEGLATPQTSQPVPEPSSLVLAFSMLGIVCSRRLLKRRAAAV